MNKYSKEPLEIDLHAPKGTYEVTVDITAHSDTTFTIYAQHRSIILRDKSLCKGEHFEITFALCVRDRHFHGGEFEKADGIKIEIATDGDITATAHATYLNLPTLYVCGDSTVTDQPAEYPYDPVKTYCGWGQAIPSLFNEKLAVSNHAQSGSCTIEFMETNLTAFEKEIQEGDFVAMGFGHNDQKRPDLDAFGGYKSKLKELCGIAKKHGATPIICSPINRILFLEDGNLKNLLGDYRAAAKEAAEEIGCPFIDMWQRTTDYFVTAGPVKSLKFFRHDENSQDYTHTNDIGGEIVAKFFAQEMIDQNGPLSEYILKDKINVEPVYADSGDKADNSAELERIKTIGLVNIPDDIDADITGLQI